eukprot:CAMPEP_0183765114 /NCGR_PEP_ID=MMETSP0739-20130205/10737_1 /TAXON_ID=385413 /ORGANISM="Thalassiosira miniscula, Strain CCMP1093" /LENGTH=33 /DNA_ID= /DNA_START= /DNA_END= /DNA_ORIENTATION=
MGVAVRDGQSGYAWLGWRGGGLSAMAQTGVGGL